MPSDNKRLAEIFKDMSNMYAFMNDTNHFRAIAYARAAQLLSIMRDDLSTFTEEELEAQEGIGHGIATKIEEFIATGKIRKYEKLKRETPYELIQLMSLSGFGPKTLKTLHDEFGVRTKAELINVLLDGRALRLRGFGEKKINNLLSGLGIHKKTEDRITLKEALRISRSIVAQIKRCKGVKQIEIAGSIRRRKSTIGDIDILVSCNKEDRPEIIHRFISMKNVSKVLVKGDTKVSVRITDLNRQVDLRLVEEDEWGAALLYLTGSKEHNIHLRTIAKERGLKINEYGMFKGTTKLAGRTEEEMYAALGMKWIKPEKRLG